MTLFRSMMIALTGVAIVTASAAQAVPKAQLIARWQKSGTGMAVDYAGWNGFFEALWRAHHGWADGVCLCQGF